MKKVWEQYSALELSSIFKFVGIKNFIGVEKKDFKCAEKKSKEVKVLKGS